jgi:GDP-L-fucose synthase
MSKPKLLVTGASGMVGRNILESPRAADYHIIAPRSSELNLLDEGGTQRFLEAARPDIIIHAAGRVGGIQANVAAPVPFLVENTRMGLNLITAAHQVGVPMLINLGSSCMYPREGVNPLTEDQILKGELEPTNEGYALAKIVSARLCEYISATTDGAAYRTLIPCNLYGRYDKFGESSSHMVPAVLRKLHRAVTAGVEPVEIWGDGTARREFMYAGDLAEFIFFALSAFERLPQNTNVGLGRDYTINEYYEAAAKVVGYKGAFKHDLSKPVGMKRKLVNVDATRALGWAATTSLESGLEQTYRYYLEAVGD